MQPLFLRRRSRQALRWALAMVLALAPAAAPSSLATEESGPEATPRLVAREAGLEDARFDPALALAREEQPAGLLARVLALIEGERGHWLAGLVSELEPLRRDPAASARLLAWRLAGREDLSAEQRALVEQLVREDQLLGDWDPDSDDERDAIAHGGARELPSARVDGPRRRVFEAVGLVRADLAALKQAENDLRHCPRMVGMDYERVAVIPASLVRGQDEALGAFASLNFDFTSDLPFPFGTVSARVHSLCRVDADGRLVTDVYASGDDVHWFEGRDVCVPLEDEEGAFVALLVVRSLGFDMAGLPDFDFVQRHAVTVGLGNLKRASEGAFAQRGERAAVARGVPAFDVVPASW